jgi:hypothetical protein
MSRRYIAEPESVMLASHLKVPCPACKGVGQLMGRVQYRDGRGCRNEMCTCPICDGAKEISLIESVEYERKYGTAART